VTRARFAVAINNRYFLLFDDGTILPTRNNLAGRAVSLMRSVIAVLLLAVTLSWAQRTPAQMDVRPIFGTTVPPYGCLPLRIIVQNDGPSVDATLVVEPSRWQAERRHLIPLPLPTGTRKEVIALPFILPNTMSVRVWLEGFRPTVEQTLSVTPDENARVVVAVGDEIGGLEFLHRLNPQQQNPPSPAPQPLFIWSWTYCRPESLPDKTAAFSGVSVVVLALGAERLTPAQWQALRRWVAMGGVLIAPGGSGAIYLRHIALATILPIRDGRIQRWSDWRSLAFFAQAKTPMGETFVTAGKPAEGAKVLVGANGIPLVAVRPYGDGAVVFTAFHFWDKPFRGWDGLPNLWRSIVEPLTLQTVAARWERTLFPLGQWAMPSRNPFGAPMPPFGVVPPMPPDVTPPLPFRLEVPSGAFILTMLLVYFLLAVPISFVILKRRRALDWQWLIAPTIALSFVFLLARTALGLYQLANQNLARAVVLLPTGESDGYLFVGATFFFQRGGTYWLDLGGDAEAVFARIGENWTPTPFRLETVEDRTIRAPLSVPNLAFRQIYFAKPIQLKGMVELRVRKEGERLLRVTCINRTPLTLKNVECRQAQPILAPSRAFGGQPAWSSSWSGAALPTVKLPDMAPGQTVTATMPLTTISRLPPTNPRFPSTSVFPRPRWVVLLAQVDGLDVAPRLNVPATRKSFVTLQVICPMP